MWETNYFFQVISFAIWILVLFGPVPRMRSGVQKAPTSKIGWIVYQAQGKPYISQYRVEKPGNGSLRLVATMVWSG